jgi:hypothetical protein
MEPFFRCDTGNGVETVTVAEFESMAKEREGTVCKLCGVKTRFEFCVSCESKIFAIMQDQNIDFETAFTLASKGIEIPFTVQLQNGFRFVRVVSSPIPEPTDYETEFIGRIFDSESKSVAHVLVRKDVLIIQCGAKRDHRAMSRKRHLDNMSMSDQIEILSLATFQKG